MGQQEHNIHIIMNLLWCGPVTVSTWSSLKASLLNAFVRLVNTTVYRKLSRVYSDGAKSIMPIVRSSTEVLLHRRMEPCGPSNTHGWTLLDGQSYRSGWATAQTPIRATVPGMRITMSAQ